MPDNFKLGELTGTVGELKRQFIDYQSINSIEHKAMIEGIKDLNLWKVKVVSGTIVSVAILSFLFDKLWSVLLK